MRKTLKAALLISSALIATPVLAQSISQPVPPEYYTLDARNVDLVTGDFNFVVREVVIGQPGQGGLAHSRGRFPVGWRITSQGSISVSGSVYTITTGLESQVFTVDGSTFTPKSDTGATLTNAGAIYTFTGSDGTVWRFTTNYCYSTTGQPCTDQATLYEVVAPNGEKTDYNYVTQTYQRSVDPISGDPIIGTVVRLQSITNNLGYQLHYKYKSDSLSGAGSLTDRINNWLTAEKITGLNNAIDYCSPTAYNCTFSRNWPSVAYTSVVGGPITATTDQSGRTTQYIYTGGSALTGIRFPGSSSNDISISYDAGRVSRVTDRTGTWNYTYVVGDVSGTTEVSGPNEQSLKVGWSRELGRASYITDAAGNTRQYNYSQGRINRISQPEGDFLVMLYGARGNVVRWTYTPKPGSSLEPIVESAVYPDTCINPVTCNLPTSTTDGRGAVTDYTYDETHGGALTITQPEPTPGAARPQTRVSYAAQTAYYKNSAGTIVAAPSTVTLPAAVSTCAAGTAPSCLGTANESRTVVTYGSVGVANNLLPTVVTNRDGSGTLSASSTMTYTPNGDLASVDGPLSGTADTTFYRYDDARQRVGVIGPDPDGGGALLRRAQRLTYNARGAITLIERGTVAGLTDPNWAAFSSLQQVATAYDGLGRPTHQRLQSGGTTYSLVQTSYDASGRPSCVTQRMNPTTFASPPASACTLGMNAGYGLDRVAKYEYDSAGQLTSTISGYGSGTAITESATYSINGLPLTLTDGKGNVSTLVYDGFDRLSRLRYPNKIGGGSSTADFEAYDYDANGNVTKTKTRAQVVTNPITYDFNATYDALDRRTLLNAPPGMADTSYTYDNLGRLLSANNGVANSQSWDALGRLTSETGPLGTMSYQYDLAGRRTRQSWPDAFYATNSWNLANEMTAVLHSGATQIVSFSYDNLGRRTGIGRSNGVNSTYGYDGASRLTSLSHDVGGTAADVTYSYVHNPAGQIIGKTTSNSAYLWMPSVNATAYTLNGLNQVTAAGSTALSYDNNGNLTHDGSRSYGYDLAKRLTGSGTASISYDALGRLDNYVGTQGARYLYDGVEAVGFATSGSTINTRFIRGPGVDEVLASYTSTGSTPAQFWLSDERGSLVDTVNGSTGLSTAINTYDEYGNPGSGNVGRFQYTGQLWVPGIGSYYYKGRSYQPNLGRFLQPDTTGYSAGANIYTYAWQDPIDYSDPYGDHPLLVAALVGFAFSAGVEAWSQYSGDGLDWSDWKSIAVQGAIGAAAGVGGGALTSVAARTFSPVVARSIGGFVGGAAGGGVGGYVGSDAAGQARFQDAATGAAVGGLFGGVASGVGGGFFSERSFMRVDQGYPVIKSFSRSGSYSSSYGAIWGNSIASSALENSREITRIRLPRSTIYFPYTSSDPRFVAGPPIGMRIGESVVTGYWYCYADGSCFRSNPSIP